MFNPFYYYRQLDYWYLLIGLLVSGGAGAMLPVFLYTFGDMMDAMNSGGTPAHPMSYYTGRQLIFGAAAFVGCCIGTGFVCMATENMLRRINMLYMESILSQEAGWFDDQDGGKLAAKISSSLASIREGYGPKLAQASFFFTTFIFGYIFAFIRQWRVTLVVSAALPLMIGGFGGFFWFYSKNEEKQRVAYEDAGGVVEETLLALRTVVSFGLEERAIKLFVQALEKTKREILTYSGLIGLTFGTIFGSFYWAEAIGFWYGAHLIANDVERHGMDCVTGAASCVTGGKVLAVFLTVVTAIFAVGQAAPCLGALSEAVSNVKSLAEVIEKKSEIPPDDKSKPNFDKVEGNVHFSKIKFSYPSRKDNIVYNGLDLKVPSGKSVALVGASGCGKSTIIQLLERYYDVDGGAVLVDGVDIRERNLHSLRDHMAIVSQEPRLFATSILENIRVGRLSASDEECHQAAKQANADAFIKEFPAGYKTYVGEGGGQLSGGQKQRIAIARAILRDPAILILDEATSALDNESEKVVQDALDRLVALKQRTTLIIAHRLSTIKRADIIAVFERHSSGSVIAEMGTHDELMQLDGIYALLVRAQSLAGVQEAAEIAETIEDLPAHSASVAELYRKYSSIRRSARGGSSRLGSRLGSRQGSRLDPTAEKGCFGRSKKVAVEEPVYKVKARKQYSLLKGHVYLTAVSFLGGIWDGTTMPLYSLLFSNFLQAFFSVEPSFIRSEAKKWAFWLLGFGFFSWAASVCRLTPMLVNTHLITGRLRIRLLTAFLHQEIAFFDDPTKGSSAYISDILASDPRFVATNVSNNSVIALTSLSSIVTALIIAFLASPKLAAVAIGCFFIMAPAGILESQVTMPSPGLSEEDIAKGEIDTETTAYIMFESMQNIKTVQAYSLEENFLGRFHKLLTKEYHRAIRQGWVTGAAWGLSQFSQFAAQAIIFWYGGKLVVDGELDTKGMLQASIGLMFAAIGLGMSTMFAADMGGARKAAGRMWEIFERESRVDVRDPHGDNITELKDAIVLKDLKFRYPMRVERPVYDKVSFDIKAGETVALVGASGCGKSTAVQLLERYYVLDKDAYFAEDGKPLKEDTTGGSILVDGTPLENLNVKSWRRCIGMVQQEPVLFTTNVKENIELGKYGEEVTMDEIEHAAVQANAHDFIMALTDQYDTSVGKRGGQLSGGQKQRVAIARALVRDPSILILDEATSALDAESEQIVQAALDKIMEQGGRTIIVIAHRLSTIKRASKIVVFKNDGTGSHVAEMGTHEELLAIPDGVYKHLAQLAMG